MCLFELQLLEAELQGFRLLEDGLGLV